MKLVTAVHNKLASTEGRLNSWERLVAMLSDLFAAILHSGPFRREWEERAKEAMKGDGNVVPE